MLKKAKKVIVNITNLWKTEGQEGIKTPQNTNVKFTLVYGKLEIGLLVLECGVWTFSYSEDFKNQSEIKPLTDFPEVDKVYEDEELYPFFMQRIPSLSQPKIKAILKEERINTDEVALLKRFGRNSITNPFQLLATF